MPVGTTKDLSIFAAKQFRESFSETVSSNVFLTFGKVTAWTNESVPDTPVMSDNNFYSYWDNMLGGKKLTTNDVRHVIPRFNWQTSTVYAQYDNLLDSNILKNGIIKFYVVTDDYNVYKCISNNYGNVSTSKPTSTSTTTDFQTVDGYIWKYMYTLTSEEQLRFTTPNFIPVTTLQIADSSLHWQVQENAIDGSVNNIIVTNGGNSYTANDVYVVITGDGEEANAYATVNTTLRRVTSIVIDNKGYNYRNMTVNLYSPTGSGATARAILSPPGGHGLDAITELGGSYIMIDGRLKNSEEGRLIINNQFRQIGILTDPTDYGTTNTTSVTVFSQLKLLTLSGSSVNYIEDEYVYQGNNLATATFKGIVTTWDSANNLIKLSNIVGVPRAELLLGETSTAARFVSFVENQDLEPYSGKLLYIDNITPIERAPDQTEDFKIVLNF